MKITVSVGGQATTYEAEPHVLWHALTGAAHRVAAEDTSPEMHLAHWDEIRPGDIVYRDIRPLPEWVEIDAVEPTGRGRYAWATYADGRRPLVNLDGKVWHWTRPEERWCPTCGSEEIDTDDTIAEDDRVYCRHCERDLGRVLPDGYEPVEEVAA